MIDESPRVSVNGRLSLYMETGEDQTSVSSDSSDVLLIPSRVKNGVSDQMNSSYNRNNTDFDTYGGLSMRGAESTSNGAKIQCREKPVECMGINHIKANQVAFAKAEIETGFYSEGTGKIVQEVDSSTSTTSPIDDDGYRKKERYECSLSGATEALKASTLCLPIVGKPVVSTAVT
ncbi:hypothetical protein YC2023_060156 [Brassica napus]